MRTFNEYREHKQDEELATLIVEAGLDPIEFCGYVLEVAAQCDTGDELYNELWGGLKGLAQGAWNGVKNNVMPMAQQAFQKAGKWASDTYQTGQKTQDIQNAQKSLNDLKMSLEKLGFDQQSLTKSLGFIHQQLQQAVTNVQQQGHQLSPDQMFPMQQNRAGQGPMVQGL